MGDEFGDAIDAIEEAVVGVAVEVSKGARVGIGWSVTGGS